MPDDEETAIDTKITTERLYLVYTVDLLVVIQQISVTVYTIGCCWHILSSMSYMQASHHDHGEHDHFTETWIEHGVEDDWKWNIKSKPLREQVVISFYFALTSLSSVGLGDFYPVSDTERLIGGIMLLFGSALFSFMSGLLIDAILTLKNVDKEYDDEDELYKFFDTIKHNYNYGMDLPKNLKDRILVHLQQRWNYSRTGFVV